MSVVAYECMIHGHVAECDVNESGQRICPICGWAVTGITVEDVARWYGIDRSDVDDEQIDRYAARLDDKAPNPDDDLDYYTPSLKIECWVRRGVWAESKEDAYERLEATKRDQLKRGKLLSIKDWETFRDGIGYNLGPDDHPYPHPDDVNLD